MSQQLISRSPDLRRLREDGYDIEIKSGHLLVKSVPYVNSNREVRRGMLAAPLGDVSGDVTRRPGDHTVYFAGEYPCWANGSPVEQIRNSTATQTVGEGVVVDHMFSAKPKAGNYDDFHHKMATYVAILERQAQILDETATARTGVVIEAPDEEYPFQYFDSASSRAGIVQLTTKVAGRNVAIVGLGGTGSYVLDLVAKTPVNEIHLIDGDDFSNHNAFRSPGAATLEELKERPRKVRYFAQRYSKMHRRVIPHETYLDDQSVGLLQNMDFVFLCLDQGGAKRIAVERLEEWEKSFIDVGMGVDLVRDELRGTLRVTASTPQKRDHLRKRVPFSNGGVENVYARNIQIAELNALNAALAVIKWKKLCGFYQDLEKEHCSAYTINGNAMVNEDQA